MNRYNYRHQYGGVQLSFGDGFIKPDKGDKRFLPTFDKRYSDGNITVGSQGYHQRSAFVNSNNSNCSNDDLIKEYRRLAEDELISFALTEIKNASYTNNEERERVIDLKWFASGRQKRTPIAIQNKVHEAFTEVYSLLNFTVECRELFIKWYIDSRLALHKVIDPDNVSKGIQDLVRLDVTRLHRWTEYPEPDVNGIYDLNQIKEYFVYQYKPIDFKNSSIPYYRHSYTFNEPLLVNKDVITFIPSGKYDEDTGEIVGYMKSLIAPYNKLAMMEDAMVIFRLNRAPNRLAIYVDTVGQTEKQAKQTLRDVQSSFSNEMSFDTSKGLVVGRDDLLSMTENYFLTRNNESKTAEIQELDGGHSSGTIEEVEYLQDKVKRATRVPLSRFDTEAQSMWIYGAGAGSQLREEERFEQFIYDLKERFTHGLFDDLIKTQLLCKGVISSDEEWRDIKKDFTYTYVESNLHAEYKEQNRLSSRATVALDLLPLADLGLISNAYIQKNVLKLSDSEIEEMSKDEKEFQDQKDDLDDLKDEDDYNMDVIDRDSNNWS